MAANTDLLMLVGDPGTATTLASPGYTTGGTTLTVGSTTNWPTTTGITFAIDEAEVVAGQEVRKDGTYNEYVGTVNSGTGITNVDWVRGVGDRDYAAGPLTRVYIPVSAERENRIVTWGLTHADQDGTLKAGAVDATTVLADGIVTNAKLSTTAGELGGAWQTWTPTFTGFSADPAGGTYYYRRVGKDIVAVINMPSAGTSNATGFTISAPVAARNIVGAQWQGSGQGKDNGLGIATPVLIRILAGTSTFDIFKDWTGTTWTNSGQKQLISATITYEAA